MFADIEVEVSTYGKQLENLEFIKQSKTNFQLLNRNQNLF